MIYKALLSSMIFSLFFSLSASADDRSPEQIADEMGCAIENDVCVYPTRRITGSEVISIISEVMWTEAGKSSAIRGENKDCKVVWMSDEDKNVGYLSFIDPDSGRPYGAFWFAKALSYKYDVTDIALTSGESDFFLKHGFRVSGRANKKYQMILHEDGDAGFGISFKSNDKEMELDEFCDIGF